MFKISPIQDKETQLSYAALCGTSFVDGSFGYAMIDQVTGELMAFSQFEILGEVGHIYDIRPRIGYEDYEALFILGRQTMNFIDICGAHICRANPNAGEERLLRAIGFKMKDDGFYFSDMTGMFDGHCDGSTVQL
jgi:hypothetical protein